MHTNKLPVLIAGVVFAVVFIIIGLAVPLDSYTTTNGCEAYPNPTKRLHLVAGQNLEKIKAADMIEPSPYVGCTQNTKFTLYLL